MGYIKECVSCENKFTSQHHSTKTCSDECRKSHRKLSRKKSRKKLEKVFICRQCGEDFVRYRKRNGFCSRSCASKMYVSNGVYDSWISRRHPKRGIHLSCVICGERFYAQPHEASDKKICGGRACRKQYMSNMFSGRGNPFYGKKHSQGSMQKQRNTLFENHGVENAYYLARRTKSSKSHIEIYNHLVRKYPHLEFVKEKKIDRYRVDIVLEEQNLIIEYNGSYWHCDPRIYSKGYYNKKKGLLSEEVWKNDEKRLNILKEIGYNVVVIWEKDYHKNKNDCLKRLEKEIN